MEASHALNLPDPNEHIPYRVTNGGGEQRQELVGNQFRDVVEVAFEGPSGGVHSVMIPAAEFNPGAVDRAIQEYLHRAEGVAALGPVPHPENAAA